MTLVHILAPFLISCIPMFVGAYLDIRVISTQHRLDNHRMIWGMLISYIIAAPTLFGYMHIVEPTMDSPTFRVESSPQDTIKVTEFKSMEEHGREIRYSEPDSYQNGVGGNLEQGICYQGRLQGEMFDVRNPPLLISYEQTKCPHIRETCFRHDGAENVCTNRCK